MKEDILEQLVEDYLNLQGYFTLTNVKYRPSKDDPKYNSRTDSVHSDIDVIGVKPGETGPKSVYAVSCKSWQQGFGAKWEYDNIKKNRVVAGRERWKTYRELTKDKWAKAFKRKIWDLTRRRSFTYVTACTYWEDPENAKFWIGNDDFKNRLTKHIEIWTVEEMFNYICSNVTTTPANSNIGRLIQVLKAAEIKVDLINED